MILLLLACVIEEVKLGDHDSGDTDADTDADSDTDTDTDSDTDTDTDTDTDADTDADTDTDVPVEDADGDGYTNDVDCDDTDPLVSPSAVDEAGDGIDQDCDGWDAGRVFDLSTAAATFVGESGQDWSGAAVAAGDYDGDGDVDLAIGAYMSSNRTTYDGTVYVFEGPHAGTRSLADADARLIGSGYTAYLGRALVTLPDLDGDGADDLAASAIGGGTSRNGHVYVYAGGMSGEVSTGDAWSSFEGPLNHGAGTHVANLGDIDDDGDVDLAVFGMSGDDMIGDIWIWSPTAGAYDETVAEVRIEGSVGWDVAGMASAGDLDGDGQTDLVVSAVGGVHVYYGPLTGTLHPADADAFVEMDTAWDYPYVASAGDTDGDGRDGFLMGSRYDGTGAYAGGAAWIVDHAPSGTVHVSTVSAALFGGSDQGAGVILAGAGDVDADGFDDVLVSSTSGTAWLVRGPVVGELDLSDADVRFESPWNVWPYTNVAGVGDLDGDGQDDIVVAFPSADDGGTQSGNTHVILGSQLY